MSSYVAAIANVKGSQISNRSIVKVIHFFRVTVPVISRQNRSSDSEFLQTATNQNVANVAVLVEGQPPWFIQPFEGLIAELPEAWIAVLR